MCVCTCLQGPTDVGEPESPDALAHWGASADATPGDAATPAGEVVARALATPAAAERSRATAAAAAAGSTPECGAPLQDSAAARLGRDATGMAALLEVSAMALRRMTALLCLEPALASLPMLAAEWTGSWDTAELHSAYAAFLAADHASAVALLHVPVVSVDVLAFAGPAVPPGWHPGLRFPRAASFQLPC